MRVGHRCHQQWKGVQRAQWPLRPQKPARLPGQRAGPLPGHNPAKTWHATQAHVLPADMVSQLRHIPWEAQHTLSTPVQWSSSHCRAPCSKGHGRRAQDLHRTCKVDCAGANELRRLSEEDFSLALKTCAARSRVGSTTRQRSRGTHRLRMHHRIGLEKSSAASHTQWRNTLLCAHNYPSLPQ